MTWPVSQGKDALSSGVSVSLASTSRERGPASTKQPREVVTLRSVDRAGRGQMLLQVVGVVAFGGAGANHVVMVSASLVIVNSERIPPLLGQRMTKRNAPNLGRHFVSDELIEPCLGTGARYFELRKWRQVDHAD